MDEKKCDCDCNHEKKWWKYKKHWGGGGHGAIYGLGIIGALFYFLQHAATFQAVVVGIFKAIFWPAFIVFKTLELLKIN